MFKYHKFISIVIGLLFVIVLQELSVPQPVFRFLLPAFLLYGAVVTVYNANYLAAMNSYNRWVVLRPLLLFFSGFGIFLFLPTPIFRGLFLTVSFLILTGVELNLGNFAENLLINETLVMAFGFFMTLAAMNQYFPQAGNLVIWPFVSLKLNITLQPLYLAAVFGVVALSARSFYEFIPQPVKTKWVAAVALGLFCVELFWALSFLPFHYSALGLVLFSLFYFCLILNYYYLYHTLTFKKIQFHLILIVLACGIAVLATPWKIIS